MGSTYQQNRRLVPKRQARLGFSTAGITHHFGSKDGLLLAVLRYRETITTPADVVGIGLLDHLRTVVVRNAATRGLVQLFVTLSAEATDPDHPAHRHFVDRYTEIVATYAESFAQARRDGDVSDDIEPTAAARDLIAFLDGIQLQWLLTPTFDMVEAYDHYVRRFRAAYQSRSRVT